MSPAQIVIHSVQEPKTSLDQYQEVRTDKWNGCPLTQCKQSIAGLPSVASFQEMPCAFFPSLETGLDSRSQSQGENLSLSPSVLVLAAAKLYLHHVLRVSPLAQYSRWRTSALLLIYGA